MTQTDLARLGEAVRLGAGLVSPVRAPLPAAVGAGIHGRVAIGAAAALMPAVSAAADIWRLCYGIDVLVRPLADGARPYLPIDMAILVPEAGEAIDALTGWVMAGEIVWREDIQEGFDNIPSTLQRLFIGSNTGKQLLKLADPM